MARPGPSRVILIVLDSVGCGALPDAAAYGDEGSDTLGNIAREVPLAVPCLRALGLDRVARIGVPPAGPADPRNPADPRMPAEGHGTWPPANQERGRGAAHGRMAEASPGKDSVTGHWEMMGIVLDRPFPTFPSGFPPDVIAGFERRIGRGTLGNVAASGTDIIDRLGAEHLRTGKPIVYTSADSVFQIAAHEDVIPVAELYRMCEVAFELVAHGLGVGRVIARPFAGAPGSFTRTANRHDYARQPPGDTLLDLLARRGIPTIAVGKVHDLFAGRGIGRSLPSAGDLDALDRVAQAMQDTEAGLIFGNLVEFDTLYGHRNDVPGYAANLERVDRRLAVVLGQLRDTDLLIVTADHGNDPTTPSTDHSREYVPLLVTGTGVLATDLGTRRTFADVGQTLAALFGVGPLPHGTSFLGEIRGEH